jgi:hypothetical protein
VGFFGVFALAWVIGVYIRAFRGTLRTLEVDEAPRAGDRIQSSGAA